MGHHDIYVDSAAAWKKCRHFFSKIVLLQNKILSRGTEGKLGNEMGEGIG